MRFQVQADCDACWSALQRCDAVNRKGGASVASVGATQVSAVTASGAMQSRVIMDSQQWMMEDEQDQLNTQRQQQSTQLLPDTADAMLAGLSFTQLAENQDATMHDDDDSQQTVRMDATPTATSTPPLTGGSITSYSNHPREHRLVASATTTVHRRPIAGNLESVRDVVATVLDVPPAIIGGGVSSTPLMQHSYNSGPSLLQEGAFCSSNVAPPVTGTYSSGSLPTPAITPPLIQRITDASVSSGGALGDTPEGALALGLPDLDTDDGLRSWIEQTVCDPTFPAFVERVERVLWTGDRPMP